jgi:hypothetical protein
MVTEGFYRYDYNIIINIIKGAVCMIEKIYSFKQSNEKTIEKLVFKAPNPKKYGGQ